MEFDKRVAEWLDPIADEIEEIFNGSVVQCRSIYCPNEAEGLLQVTPDCRSPRCHQCGKYAVQLRIRTRKHQVSFILYGEEREN